MDNISIRKSFAGKSVLVTGASGLIGKVLVEKLLYDVDGIQSIYILFRSKRGFDFRERFEKFKESKAFDRVKTKNPKLMQKVIPINADLNHSPYLGIAPNDLEQLKKDVKILFHLAATVKFNEPLEVALKLNMIATHNLLKMAQSFDKLEVFVYVSTAFSNVQLLKIEERIHSPVYDYKRAMKATMEKDYGELNKINEIVKENFPNTYTFSKHLTEQLVNEFSHEIPIVVIRPSIVTPSSKEPFEGWNDNIRNFMALCVAVGNGLVRVVHFSKNKVMSDFVPCDFVTNAMMASSAQKISSADKKISVVNCSFGKQFPNSFEDLVKQAENLAVEHLPFENMIWYPHVEGSSIYPIYVVKFFLYQMLPAIFIDFMLILMFKKPFLVKIQKEIFKALDGFSYFIWNQWRIDNDEFVNLHERLSKEEK